MRADHESTPAGRASRMGSASATRLHGRWLLLARIAWAVVAALFSSLFLLGLLLYAAQLQMVCTTSTGACSSADLQALHDLGISVDSYVWYTVVMKVLVALVWMSVGLVIFWRRSDDWMALLMAIFLVTFSASLRLPWHKCFRSGRSLSRA
jgi:hypothetical protein